MDLFPISPIAIVLAAAAHMVLGFVWFGPLFGKTWMKLMKYSKDDMMKNMKNGMGMTYVLAAAAGLVMAYIMSHNLEFGSSYLSTSGLNAGLNVGFWNWLGFVATVTLGMVLWEGKSWKLWALLNGYWLVSMLVMGVILAQWL